MRLELTRHRVVPGQGGTVDAWMRMLNERAEECRATLGPQRMAVEAVFRLRDEHGEWLYWFELAGEGGATTLGGELAAEHDHRAFAEAAREPGHTAATPEVLLMPTPVEDAVRAWAGAGARPAGTGSTGPLAIGVEPMTAAHAGAVLRIFGEGIEFGNATFETAVPDWDRWDAGHLDQHRFVALEATGDVVGWTAASPVSDRCAYSGVVELSTYIAAAARRRGVGRALLATVIASTEAAGIWTLQAGAFPENLGSLRSLTQAGFRVVGRRDRLGRHQGVWRDVILLERRSERVV